MAAPFRILSVDNEPAVPFSLKYVFAEPRYELLSAQNAEEALAHLEANPSSYDVIIVDQKMPDLSGIELVAEIRKRGISGKIIVLSGHLSSEVRESYEQMDVHAIFPKPFDIRALRSAVEHGVG